MKRSLIAGVLAMLVYLGALLSSSRHSWVIAAFALLLTAGCLSLIAARYHKAWLVLTLLVATTACVQGYDLPGSNTLIIDEVSAAEYASKRCEWRHREGLPPCTFDPVTQSQEFEKKLHSALRSDPTCDGFNVIELSHRADMNAERSRWARAWWLFVEFDPVESDQRWTTVRGPNPQTQGGLTGLGQPPFIAHATCEFMNVGGRPE